MFASWTVAWLLVSVPLRLLVRLLERLGVAPIRPRCPLDVLVAITLGVAIVGLQLAMTVLLYRSFRSDDR